MAENQKESDKIKNNQKKSETIEQKPVQWPMMPAEIETMVSSWMKDKHGVTGSNWGNNIPKGILTITFIPGAK